ncbi:MAG: FAD-dependent oxidoreductase [Proteobacteria bacterium]|nr:FAD-dependent oxidoreductase [Pseudomonadota bacterium]
MTKQKASPKPRIVIIGGGIDGCTNAIELAKEKNNEIFIFEQNPEILQGIGI